MRTKASTTVSILALLLSAAAPAGAGSMSVAIVVNPANPTATLPAKTLKQIFAGEKSKWPNGQKIQTLATTAELPEHKIAVQFLFGMSEQDYKKWAMQQNFVGKGEDVPRESGSSQAIINQVSLIPGAIGFVRADLVNDKVKVVKIDGMGPGDEGYPLIEK